MHLSSPVPLGARPGYPNSEKAYSGRDIKHLHKTAGVYDLFKLLV